MPARSSNLESRIAELRADVQSDRLSMSIGELAGLYERGELDIHPKFQRILRWSVEQKTKLIESLLLRIPIPPIFVSQSIDGLWDVVDGVQRLGTIFEFLGILKGSDEVILPPLVLTRTVLVPELEGVRFETGVKKSDAFSQAQRLDFRRTRLDLHIILKESTPSSKYELFERLNTGGSIASPQEVRNCVLVWMNESRYDWMLRLCENPHFQSVTPLSERLIKQQFRMELLLRFLVLYRVLVHDLRGIRDLSEFLNDRNREFASDQSVDLQQLETVFTKTFALLDETLGGDVFRKYEVDNKRHSGAFLISSFEAISMGVAHNIGHWVKEASAASKLKTKAKTLWSREEFLSNIGIGISSSARLLHTIPFGRKHFSV